MVALNVAKDIEPVLMLARQGRFDEAATATSALLLRAPADATLHALAGALALQRGRLEEAVTHLDKALAGRPQDSMARSDLIEALHRLGRHERVLSLVDMNFLRADASRVLARIAGASAQAIERYSEAVSYYELVLSAQPRDWTIRSNLGNAFLALGQPDKAIDAQRQALKLAPDAQPVLLNLAHALIEANHRDEAETVLADMIRNFPEDANPHFSRFGMLYADGREEEAQQALVRAAALAPEKGDIQLALGQHATRLGLFERAAEAFYRAEALNMAPDEVYVGLGGALERLNKEDKLPDLRKQAETQGASAPALAFLDLMIARRAGHHDQAFALLDQARAVLSDDQAAQIEGPCSSNWADMRLLFPPSRV
jgi:Flp pilus assembly protein TadD